jgi:hypothetical protein
MPGGLRTLLASLSLALMVPLCSPAQATFWDAFEAGRKANAAGDYTEAIKSLEQALAQRPESAKRVRLYGTNFADDYFPYTELGYAYLKSGKPQRAAEIFEKAIAAGVEPGDRLRSLLASAREAMAQGDAPKPPASPPAAPPPAAPPSQSAPEPPAPAQRPAVAVEQAPASVRFLSTPPGATVKLDGRPVGTTPLVQSLPGEGERRVRFELAGHTPVEKTFQVRAGERLTIPAEMVASPRGEAATPSSTPAPSTGELELEVRPEGTEVLVDGVSKGPAGAGPLLIGNLSGGDHTLELRRLGFEPKRTSVRIQPGVRIHYQTDLSPGSAPGPPSAQAAPRTSPSPALYGGLAAALVLAAAAAVLAILRLRRRQAATPAPQLTLDSSVPAHAIAGYVIRSKLGSGGMADVFLADDARARRMVALKVPLARFCEDATYSSRFLREGQIGQALTHDGIIRIYEAGQADGRLFIAMEFVDGENLKATMARLEKPFTPHEAARLVRDVADVLAYTHSKGVIHRDLKPENIMVVKGSRRVKVADFGVAKLVDATSFTTTGQILGTPNYLPPEPFIGEPYRACSDLYSLGVIFFEMLTLVRPFEAETLIETIRKHQDPSRPVPSAFNPAVPRDLDALVVKLVQIKPADRFQSAGELIAALDAVLPGLHPPDQTIVLAP